MLSMPIPDWNECSKWGSKLWEREEKKTRGEQELRFQCTYITMLRRKERTSEREREWEEKKVPLSYATDVALRRFVVISYFSHLHFFYSHIIRKFKIDATFVYPNDIDLMKKYVYVNQREQKSSSLSTIRWEEMTNSHFWWENDVRTLDNKSHQKVLVYNKDEYSVQ